MNSKDKARLLGLFFWIYTALNILLLAGIGIIYISIFGFVFSQQPHRPDEPDPAIFMTIMIAVFAFLLIFTILFAIPKIIAGYGLRNGKPWARVWSIIASVMACTHVPLGTAIGVFGLVFLFSDDGKRYFSALEAGRGPILANPGMTPPPPPNSWQ